MLLWGLKQKRLLRGQPIMMFSRDDLAIESVEDLVHFLPILVFIGLVAPFLIAAYTVGFVMDITGWLKSS